MNAVPILVGIDFSEGAERALAQARHLAQWLGTKVSLVHVVESFDSGSWIPDEPAIAWLERNRVDSSGLVVRQGFPWVELVRYGHEVNPGMIVVGSHGLSGFQPLAPGSTAARLGVLSPFPVLVVTSAKPAMESAPTWVAAVRSV
jgi:nucleotide-binding universal stress UspA family protein